MKKQIKTFTVVVSFSLMMISFLMLGTLVFAWYNGQSYIGKTMSYTKRVYIGSRTSDIVNFYGREVNGELVYEEIDPEIGFEANNLAPGNYMYLKTEISNTESSTASNVTLFLQGVYYDAPLNDFLYFGTTDPEFSRETYKNQAITNPETGLTSLESIPLANSLLVDAGDTLELYWFVYIDSDAGNEVQNTNINLGVVVISFV